MINLPDMFDIIDPVSDRPSRYLECVYRLEFDRIVFATDLLSGECNAFERCEYELIDFESSGIELKSKTK